MNGEFYVKHLVKKITFSHAKPVKYQRLQEKSVACTFIDKLDFSGKLTSSKLVLCLRNFLSLEE
jgi:hypothetical protein